MTVKELIEKLQEIKYQDQEIFVSVNDDDGLDIINLEESPLAVFIKVNSWRWRREIEGVD